MGDILNAIFLKNVKIDPQEYLLQGSPPSTIYKNSKNIERTQFRWAKLKTRTFSNYVKIHPHKYVSQGSPKIIERTLFRWSKIKTPIFRNTFYRGPPPSTTYKNSKNIKRNLIWWAIIKTQTFSKYVKIDPHEYVLQGSPPPLLSTKTQKS